MQLQRKHFEAHGNIAALDYAAVLVHITGSMWEMQRQFELWGFIDAGKAGNTVIETCRRAISALTKSATMKNPAAELEKVRRKHVRALAKATESSHLLAMHEQKILRTGYGLMTVWVHAPLVALVKEWGGQPYVPHDI